MKKLIFAFVLMSAFTLKAQASSNEEAERMLLAKFSTEEIQVMKKEEKETFDTWILFMKKGFFVTDQSTKSENLESVAIQDLANLNPLSIGLAPLEDKNQYFKIEGTNKMLVIYAKIVLNKLP